MTTPKGWTYIEKYGSVYRVENGHLFYAPMLINNVPDLTSQAEVELENIEPAIAQELRATFNLKV